MIKKYSITVNGNTYDVEVEELGVQNTQVSRQQVTNSVNPQPQVKQAPQPQVEQTPQPQVEQTPQQQVSQKIVEGNESVSAPMPGTINSISVKVGDSIKKGQVLLILEAMKMENEIIASCDGTVLAINVSKGSSVSVGDALITIG